jgi:hypothetical protein
MDYFKGDIIPKESGASEEDEEEDDRAKGASNKSFTIPTSGSYNSSTSEDG